MNKKSLIILSSLCSIVVIASVFLLTQKPTSNPHSVTLGLTDIAPSAVTKLTYTNPMNTAEVVKSENGWMIGGASVQSTSTLENFLTSLSSARATQVSKDGRTVSTYGFTDGRSTISLETTDKKTLSLDVGAPGPVTGSVYVSRPDSTEVYLLEGTSLGELIGEDWSSWSATTTPAQ